MGLLNNCDFQINQIQLSPQDFQFYSDWFKPASWITYQGTPISSHPATRHFWLFVQIQSGGVQQPLAWASLLRRELELSMSNSDAPDGPDFRVLCIEDVLESFRQNVLEKEDHVEIIMAYHPTVPWPNPMASFSRSHAQAMYFYLLVVYNLEIRQAIDLIWSDFQVAVDLSSFTATAGPGLVVLEWTTESERQNLGFHLLRSSSPGEPFVTLNRKLIPSASQGNSETTMHYRYVDDLVSEGFTYQYQLADINFRGDRTLHGIVSATPLASDLDSGDFHLVQNYPNPFNAVTEVRYQIHRCGHVIINIYNIRGELVEVLGDDFQPAGEYSVRWDGLTYEEHVAGSGLYFCALRMGARRQVMKMVLLR
jgi:hypothetical protein